MTHSKHAMTSTQASKVKLAGHKKEKVFDQKFNKGKGKINYSGASADCTIDKDDPILPLLEKKIGLKARTVSLKSSRTIQIHLGNIPELTDKQKYSIVSTNPTCVDHKISFAKQVEALESVSFWNKYLNKGEYLVYQQKDGSYVFFSMPEVINFIIAKCIWRKLPTGRLKGDFFHKTKNKNVQILTYEYRSKKKMFVLGAHGGSKGFEFIELLKLNLKHHIERR